MVQCNVDIKFKLKSKVGVRDFVKHNLRVRNDKRVENHCTRLFFIVQLQEKASRLSQ